MVVILPTSTKHEHVDVPAALAVELLEEHLCTRTSILPANYNQMEHRNNILPLPTQCQ